MAKRGTVSRLVAVEGDDPKRRNRVNFFELAYQKIEEHLVTCELRPGRFLTRQDLHTLFRRIGYLYHSEMTNGSSLGGTVTRHLAQLNAVANRHVERAVTASDELIDFVDAMFEPMEQGIAPWPGRLPHRAPVLTGAPRCP